MSFWQTLKEAIFGKKSEVSAKQTHAKPPDAASQRSALDAAATSAEPSCDQQIIGGAASHSSSILPSPTTVQSPPTSRRWDGPSAITIGLDFGTHSTKIILRPRGSEKASLLRICKPQEGYPEFACPSLVRIIDSRVCFGSKALEVSGGKLYRSLKMQLLPSENCGGNDVISAIPAGP